ncbi:NADH dehydrogenase [ubiquinone] 1 alpha subcomplex subunit 10, mitochondrial [Oryzias melastigma]|uniref:NADH dehydrogenase [ubiquinone] 1 alpha subcomplex subunit 10, mitochondrial n=1 Tax=Oryzias melastigma TaxID=30732 RepID=A0A834CIA7_ORYME|nr:NADH dehydrogenase [ubiquinone] 1 alpha subcomplex subunit 10, mitochondrial [Oryzias melastigma]
MVFLDAMFKQGYIRKECVQHYNEIKGISICEFLPPHLVIYVDSPAEEVQKKLRQSGKVRRRRGKRFCSCQAQTNNFFQPYLQNVPLEYLKSIEESYKKSFLPEIKEKAELLTYDATEVQDVDKVSSPLDPFFISFKSPPSASTLLSCR